MTKVICHMRCGFPLAHYRAGVTVPGKPEEIEVTDKQLVELRADCRVVFVDSLATPAPIAAPAPIATPAPMAELPGDNSSEDSDQLNSVDEDQELGEGTDPDDQPVVEDPEPEVPAKKPKKKPARKRKAKK